MVATTLGTTSDEQLDTIDGDMKESLRCTITSLHFLLVKLVESVQWKKRSWAWKTCLRAINPILKRIENFPYTIRVVSEITESNGSSSMATVCGASMSLMDAGVPLSKPVRQSMGLIKEEKKFVVLTDILGDEDRQEIWILRLQEQARITSLQMDIKVNGITKDILDEVLSKALKARTHILSEMNKV